MSAGGLGAPAHLQAGIVILQCPRDFLIHLAILFRGSGPEGPDKLGIPRYLDVRFVPHLPVTDVVVKAVGPATVVVHGDVLADLGELVEIRGRCRIRAPTPPHAVIDLRAAVHDGLNDAVTRAEMIAPLVLRVRVPIAKDRVLPRGADRSGNGVRIGPLRIHISGTEEVVSADDADAEIPVLGGHVGKLAWHQGRRPAIDALEGSDGSDDLGGIDVHFRHRSGCK